MPLNYSNDFQPPPKSDSVNPPEFRSATAQAIKQPEIILTSFGLQAVRPVIFKAGAALSNILSESFGSLRNYVPPDKAVATSLLGTPVFSNLVIPSGTYTDINGNEIPYGSDDPANPFTINCVLFEVQRQKNTVITEVVGREYPFIEHISNGAYQITVRGALMTPYQDVLPFEEMQILNSILNANKSIKVQSEYLQIFGIDMIYITSESMGQLEGRRNIQPFQFSAVADIPFELIID